MYTSEVGSNAPNYNTEFILVYLVTLYLPKDNSSQKHDQANYNAKSSISGRLHE